MNDVILKKIGEAVLAENDLIVKSPGRINLIGEHIDYNGGLVLPAATNLTITLAFRQNETNSATIWSQDFAKGFEINLDKIEPSNNQWENYILGVLFYINEILPNKIKGFDCNISSNLPIGSGISSSAALECGIAKGINSLFNLGLTDQQIITLARKAEHQFVGTNCGIMDQYAVVKGVENGLLLLNCENENHSIVPANFGNYEIVLLNTNVSHNLATSEYNTRRFECETALKLIQSDYPQYKYLANVPMSILLKFKKNLSNHLFTRAHYVVEENYRVKKAVKALNKGNITNFGALLYESHEGLKDLYEVSCLELDFLVDYSKEHTEVIGSRMMGGGFGGCTINLIHKDFSDDYIVNISKAYKKQFNTELTTTKVTTGNGVTTHKK